MDVSVIIPVYNAAEFLESSVQSALQFPEVKEVLLIEDGSTDNSWEVAKKISESESRVKLLQHPNGENRGAGATRNLGLDNATQEFIAFLDADDYYLPNRFDAEKELFQSPEIDGVFGTIGTEFYSIKGKENFIKKFNSSLTKVNYHARGMEVFEGLMLEDKGFGVFFHLNTLTVRKVAIENKNLRFNPYLRIHQDTDFIRKLSYNINLSTGIIEEAIAIRGVHDDNRITAVKQYSKNFYQNLLKLYSSTYYWARDQSEMKPLIKEHISLRYKSFKIANMKGIQKYLFFIIYCLKNPKLLKTRYRFHALNTPRDEKD